MGGARWTRAHQTPPGETVSWQADGFVHAVWVLPIHSNCTSGEPRCQTSSIRTVKNLLPQCSWAGGGASPPPLPPPPHLSLRLHRPPAPAAPWQQQQQPDLPPTAPHPSIHPWQGPAVPPPGPQLAGPSPVGATLSGFVVATAGASGAELSHLAIPGADWRVCVRVGIRLSSGCFLTHRAQDPQEGEGAPGPEARVWALARSARKKIEILLDSPIFFGMGNFFLKPAHLFQPMSPPLPCLPWGRQATPWGGSTISAA